MNSSPAAQVWQRLRLTGIRQHPLFHDSVSVAAVAVAALLNLATLLVLIVKVHHATYPVPTHYLSLVGFDQTGPWYSVYRFVVFGVAVLLGNGFLAAKSFQRNRLASFFLLLGAVVAALLCLVVSVAFGGIV